MAESFVINPYLQFLHDTRADPRFIFFAPTPGKGLTKAAISRSEDPDLFLLFNEVSEANFRHLDCDSELTDEQRDFLLRHGIIVYAETQPVKPLFSCPLDDVAGFEGAVDTAELIVNAGFRFEPFDLTNFAERAKHALSPHQASVWIEAAAGVEIGYWISRDLAPILSRFEAGRPVPAGIDVALLRKLTAADVVSTRDRATEIASHWRDSLASAQTKFAREKYAVVPGIFPPEQMRAMQAYYRQYVAHGFMVFGDDRVEKRYGEYREAFASFLHPQLTAIMCAATGRDVKPSYSFAAAYVDGAVLPPHTDRRQCEYSISFQLDYQPETNGGPTPWPICLEPLEYEGSLPDIGYAIEWDKVGRDPASIDLANGDGLIYKGRDLVHYRHALPAGHTSTSLFFHFVDKDFAGDLD
jgi:hypothetical protein